jgi:hypothetical protein
MADVPAEETFPRWHHEHPYASRTAERRDATKHLATRPLQARSARLNRLCCSSWMRKRRVAARPDSRVRRRWDSPRGGRGQRADLLHSQQTRRLDRPRSLVWTTRTAPGRPPAHNAPPTQRLDLPGFDGESDHTEPGADQTLRQSQASSDDGGEDVERGDHHFRIVAAAAFPATLPLVARKQPRFSRRQPIGRLPLPDSLSHATVGRPRGCSDRPTATLSPRGPRMGRSPMRMHGSVPVGC